MGSEKGWTGVMMSILTLSLLLMPGCGEKKSDEKLGEDLTRKFIKESTGKDVDVKIQKGKIELEEKGGSKTVIAEATTWPSDMFKDVPQFPSGKIEHVVKSNEEGGMRKFNIHYIDLEGDALNKYADILKKNGWQTDVMQMGDKGGMLNAEKGKLAINFPFNLEKKRGILAAFNLP